MICKAFAVLVLLPLLVAAQTIELVNGSFAVTGWSPGVTPADGDWSSVFAIHAGAPDSPGDPDSPPVLGSYSAADGVLIFKPRFPLAAGVQYRAVFAAPGGPRTEAVFDGPRRESNPTAKVAHVYPSAEVLPANALKMYVYFSAPMSRGEAWKHIHVLDELGRPLEEFPFLVVDQELWDPTYTRLTLIFDPGRIKREILVNLQLGTPIVEGKTYNLVIDREWLDARGVPMAEDFRKTFRGGAADRIPPYPREWRVTAPMANTLTPLVIDFPKPMDYALVQRLIGIPGVTGSVAIDHEEKQWRFTPDQPWKPGDYRLVIDRSLEDWAGNKIDRPFDVDTFNSAYKPSDQPTESLSFQVR